VELESGTLRLQSRQRYLGGMDRRHADRLEDLGHHFEERRGSRRRGERCSGGVGGGERYEIVDVPMFDDLPCGTL
jgi:hypothetical protein